MSILTPQTGKAEKTTDQMLDKISELLAERGLLQAAITAATTRYERSAYEDPTPEIATDMYIALAATGDLERRFMEGTTRVLLDHQRATSSACSCGWEALGYSFPQHQAEMIVQQWWKPAPEAVEPK